VLPTLLYDNKHPALLLEPTSTLRVCTISFICNSRFTVVTWFFIGICRGTTHPEFWYTRTMPNHWFYKAENGTKFHRAVTHCNKDHFSTLWVEKKGEGTKLNFIKYL